MHVVTKSTTPAAGVSVYIQSMFYMHMYADTGEYADLIIGLKFKSHIKFDFAKFSLCLLRKYGMMVFILYFRIPYNSC